MVVIHVFPQFPRIISLKAGTFISARLGPPRFLDLKMKIRQTDNCKQLEGVLIHEIKNNCITVNNCNNNA